MRYLSTALLALASATLIMAIPTPQVLNEDANERANDGQKAIENEIKIQESIALTDAGCAGAVIEGDVCEAIDAQFQAKLADILGTDDADAAADDNQDNQDNNNDNQNNNNDNQNNNNDNQNNNNDNNQGKNNN